MWKYFLIGAIALEVSLRNVIAATAVAPAVTCDNVKCSCGGSCAVVDNNHTVCNPAASSCDNIRCQNGPCVLQDVPCKDDQPSCYPQPTCALINSPCYPSKCGAGFDCVINAPTTTCASKTCAKTARCDLINGVPEPDPCSTKICPCDQQCVSYQPSCSPGAKCPPEVKCVSVDTSDSGPSCRTVRCTALTMCALSESEVECVAAPCLPTVGVGCVCRPKVNPCDFKVCGFGYECVPYQPWCKSQHCPLTAICVRFPSSSPYVPTCGCIKCPAGSHCEMQPVNCSTSVSGFSVPQCVADPPSPTS